VRIAVLTISDRAARGEYEDKSGPGIERVLLERMPGAEIVRAVVTDDAEAIRGALDRFAGLDGGGENAGADNPGAHNSGAPSPGAENAGAAEAAGPPFDGRPADFIITTGGTGLGPRDITPEVTRKWCERELPGIAEAIRRESMMETRTAMLSRGCAGSRGSTIVVNVPGSVNGAVFAVGVIAPVMEHAVSMLSGGGH
jgi:molybdopterin biosynthesis enzyme MoaB